MLREGRGEAGYGVPTPTSAHLILETLPTAPSGKAQDPPSHVDLRPGSQGSPTVSLSLNPSLTTHTFSPLSPFLNLGALPLRSRVAGGACEARLTQCSGGSSLGHRTPEAPWSQGTRAEPSLEDSQLRTPPRLLDPVPAQGRSGRRPPAAAEAPASVGPVAGPSRTGRQAGARPRSQPERGSAPRSRRGQVARRPRPSNHLCVFVLG